MDRYDYWTHGSNVVVERPEQAASVERRGRGTTVRQSEASHGWFDFPIPSPTVLEDVKTVKLRQLRIRATCNEHAFLIFAAVHVDGSDRLWELDLKREGPGLTGRIDHALEAPDGTVLDRVTGGVSLCVLVEFRTGAPRGEIVFHGAGALYNA